MTGYVYILSNPSMPGLLKIGRSVRGGHSRAKNMYQTGVPAPFVLEFEMLVDCPEDIEALVHEKLQMHRVSDSREFFKVDVLTAKHAVIECELREEDYTVCSLDEYSAIEGAMFVASKSDAVWLDVCDAISWLEPEDITRAQRRKLFAVKTPMFDVRAD